MCMLSACSIFAWLQRLIQRHEKCISEVRRMDVLNGGQIRRGRALQMNRKGFTLIELLIVVVIIGILAAIAIPKFANTKEKAYLASMKSDLRNLVTAEEAFFADSVKYTSTVGAGGVLFNTTSGVVGPTIAVTADGWTANVSHTTTTKTCSIYVGSTALAPANKEGEPKCQ